jgi:hypothetical protein
MQKTGIQKAVEGFDGSPTKLAAALGKGVSRQTVEHWLRVGHVSPGLAPNVADVSGQPIESLDSTTDWHLVPGLLARHGSARRGRREQGGRQDVAVRARSERPVASAPRGEG